MQNRPGLFIVLEGSDGSGKGTQFEALKNRLIDAGHEVEVFDFPRYDQPSSYFITRYLNGEYGPAGKVNPYTASLFFALDRYEAAPQIRQALEAGKIVLSNRYVGSNMAHQGTKFSDEIEKRSFFIWEDSIEFQLLAIPRPTLNIYLRVPANISYELIAKKKARNYTTNTHDEHEADITHLQKAVETYDLLCQLFPRDFQAIECVENGQLLSIESISQEVWDSLQPLLPSLDARAEETVLAEPAPKTDTEKSNAAELTWAIARLSYLAASEIKAVMPALQINSTSWSGPGSDYSFHIPEALSAEHETKYKTAISGIAKQHKTLHSDLSRALISNNSLSRGAAAKESSAILRSATPVAAYVSAELSIAKHEAYETLRKISLLQNEEVQKLSLSLSEQIRRLWPDTKAELSETDAEQELPEAIGSIIEKLTQDIIPKKGSAGGSSLKLLEAWPRNEFDLIADGLASYSNLSRDEIMNLVSRWNYQQKTEALTAALPKSHSTLERATYRLECLQDWQTFMAWLDYGIFDNIQRQLAVPSDSYEVPQAIEEAVLEDAYSYIFSQAYDIYQTISAEHGGRTLEYATLLGHRLRWQMSVSASGVSRLLTDRGPEAAEPLIKLIESVHPTVAEYIGRSREASTQPQSKPARVKGHRRHSKKK